MWNKLAEKLRESAQSVLPVSLIVLVLHMTLAPLPLGTLALSLCGTALLIVGMSIFTLGADLAMMPMGEAIGAELTKSRKLWLIILSGFILGVVVTIAEPDLQVLTKQVPAVPDMVLVGAVATGVGVFFVLALLRILFHAPISVLFVVSYALVFVAAAIFSPDFLAVAFDSGGVTTGPITVPFILALGAGIATVRGGSTSEEDSFGLCALCSIGPVFAVLFMGMFYSASGSGHAFATANSVGSMGELVRVFVQGFGGFFREVLTVLLPIIVIFGLYQVVRLKLSRTALIRIGIGILYTLVGLSIFLTGVNIGFMPAGQMLGTKLAQLPYNWILLPLSAVLGFAVVFAEPAVHLLTQQIEDITSGTISRRMMMLGLAVGVSIALVLSVLRVLLRINIWWMLAPGYIVALALTLFAPKLFTAIAFDSGGVASGTMTAAFLLPFAVGICKAVGGNIMTDAFGIIAMVAMMPLITIQILGIMYGIKMRRSRNLDPVPEEFEGDDFPFDIPLQPEILPADGPAAPVPPDRLPDAPPAAEPLAEESAVRAQEQMAAQQAPWPPPQPVAGPDEMAPPCGEEAAAATPAEGPNVPEDNPLPAEAAAPKDAASSVVQST